MNFGYMPSYYNPLDRGYDNHGHRESPLGEVELGNIGISTMPTGNQMDQLKARIFQGASRVELGFSGRGKGSMGGQNTTPEMYGTDEREDIRQMADFNKVKLSVHASYNVGPLSGMTQQGFDNGARESTIREIERAIDFAADTARGGAVVIHTGEFPRALSEMDHEKYGNFEMYPLEDKEATMHLVDKQTGQIIQSVKKNQKVVMPIFKDEENLGIENVKPVEKYGWWPEPDFDIEKGEFKVKERSWDELEKIKDWYNKTAREEAIRTGKEPPKEMSTEEVAYRATLESRKQYAAGWAKDYGERYRQAYKTKEELESLAPKLQGIENTNRLDSKTISQLDRLRLLPADFDRLTEQQKLEFVKQKANDWRSSISESMENSSRMMDSYREASVSQFQQAKEYEEMEKRAVPISQYAIEKTADSIARAAEFAHKKSETLKEKGLLKSPIYVSPENIFPETYGAHPQEIKQIISDARDKYVETYKARYGEDQARKYAEEHIKGTFDIGHAYTWRKYYKEDPSKSFEQNDKDFNKWLMKEVDDLNKKGYIGHIHVSDNFGYEDEHVTPGQGRAPIKDFIDRMKKAGNTEIVVEPAHQDFRAMLGAWKEFGAPVYGADQSLQKWSDVQFSYFGKTRSPYFVFGEYSPSQDFTLWSQVPLE